MFTVVPLTFMASEQHHTSSLPIFSIFLANSLFVKVAVVQLLLFCFCNRKLQHDKYRSIISLIDLLGMLTVHAAAASRPCFKCAFRGNEVASELN